MKTFTAFSAVLAIMLVCASGAIATRQLKGELFDSIIEDLFNLTSTVQPATFELLDDLKNMTQSLLPMDGLIPQDVLSMLYDGVSPSSAWIMWDGGSA